MVEVQGEATGQQQIEGAGLPGRASVRWLAALASLVVLGAAAGFLWIERQQELDAAADLGVRRSAHLVDDLQSTLAVAKVALTLVESKLNALPPGTALDEGLRQSMADARPLLASLALPLALQALGDDGRLIGPNMLPGSLVPPALDLPEASRWRAAPALGTPGQRVLPMVRRAAAGRHGVAAWLVAFDHAALVSHFDDSRVREGGGAALFRVEPDGSLVVLARAPHNEAELARRVRGPMADALSRAPRGTFVALTQIDQKERVVAYQRLDGDAAELALGYGLATEAVLAPWRSALPWAAGSALLLIGAVVIGARRLERALQALGQQQLALQRSENHFRTLADNVPDVVVRMDREGRHLYANPAVAQATGLPPEAFIGKTNAELGMPADNVAVWMAALRRVFDHGRSERLEFAYPRPQGVRHWESVVALEPPASGAAATALVISRDITERKQADAAREALSRRMVDLLETMSDGFVSLDREWRYQAVNRKAALMLGRDAASLIGKHIWTEFPDGVGQPFHRAYERAMNDGESVVLEEHYAPWGKWFENRIHPSPDGISIFFTEITERVRAAQALQASEAHHRELFESNPHPMWVYDLETLAFLAVNDAALRQYGYSRDEFLRMSIKDIRPPEDVPRLLANIAAVGDGIDDAGTWRHRTKDGRLLEIEITSHTLQFDGRAAELVLAHDVTRRNAAERALRENEERLRLALQAASQGLFDLDVRSGDAVVSPEYARMLGFEPEHFRESAAAWLERLHPDDRARVTQYFEDYLAGRRSDYSLEFRQRTRDGGWKWILSIGRVQERDDEGRPVRMLGTHTDITAVKQAQAALAESEARLNHLLRSAPTVIYTARAEGDFGATYYSPNVHSLLGWQPEQFTADPRFWLDHVHPGDRDAVLAQMADLPRLGEIEIEYRFADVQGHWRWMRDGMRMVYDADGRPAEMVGSWVDTTERRAATERFEKLFLAAPEGISISALDSGRFLQVNDAFCQLFGRPREVVIGHTSTELGMWTHPQSRDAIVARLRAGETIQGFEGRARHGSGAEIDVLFSAERVQFSGTDCLLLMFRDITQRKRAEAALRRSEQRFRLAAASGQVWEWDFAAGGVIAPNEFFATLGLPAVEAEQVKTAFEAAVHPDDLTEMKRILARHLKGEGPYQMQFRARDAQGRWRWFDTQGQALRDEQGRAYYMAGTTFEITERREAEEQVQRLATELEQRVVERTEQLTRSEARYRNIFETVPVSIGEEDWSAVQRLLRDLRAEGVTDGPAYFAARPDFVQQCLRAVKVQRLNRQALALHDAQDLPASVTGLESFYPRPEDLSQFVGELEAMWAGQRVFTAKRSLPSVAGRPLHLMLTMSLPGLDDEDGMALVCLVDITEIDRLNAELDRSVVRLRQANQELETFTYSVSHDLKAPLRGIDGYSRLLLTDHREQLDNEGREFLDHIRQATKHMGELIDDLLNYSRLERRELTLARQPLGAVVEGVLAGFRQELAAAAVELEVRIDPDLSALADAQGLTLALRNLIDNAIKFSRAGTRPRITIEAERRDGCIELSVRDNGVGFDMKFHDRIFSIFQRLHRSEDYPGTGIGLAMVRKAMERMGGRVRANSRPGEGAAFTLRLPESDEI